MSILPISNALSSKVLAMQQKEKWQNNHGTYIVSTLELLQDSIDAIVSLNIKREIDLLSKEGLLSDVFKTAPKKVGRIIFELERKDTDTYTDTDTGIVGWLNKMTGEDLNAWQNKDFTTFCEVINELRLQNKPDCITAVIAKLDDARGFGAKQIAQQAWACSQTLYIEMSLKEFKLGFAYFGKLRILDHVPIEMFKELPATDTPKLFSTIQQFSLENLKLLSYVPKEKFMELPATDTSKFFEIMCAFPIRKLEILGNVLREKFIELPATDFLKFSNIMYHFPEEKLDILHDVPIEKFMESPATDIPMLFRLMSRLNNKITVQKIDLLICSLRVSKTLK